MAIVGILLLRMKGKMASSSPPPTSALGLAHSLAQVEAQSDWAQQQDLSPERQCNWPQVTQSASKEKKRADPGAQPGYPMCLPPQRGLPGAIVPDRSRPAAGGTAGPGDSGKPAAGAGSRSQSPWGLSCWTWGGSRSSQLGPCGAGAREDGQRRGCCEPRGEAAPPPTALNVGEAADTTASCPPPPKRGQLTLRTRAGGEGSEGCA